MSGKLIFSALSALFSRFDFFAVSEFKFVSRNYGRYYKPDCCKRYKAVNYNRADRAGSLKNPAYEIEVENSVKSPVKRTDKDKNVRTEICYNHNSLQLKFVQI